MTGQPIIVTDMAVNITLAQAVRQFRQPFNTVTSIAAPTLAQAVIMNGLILIVTNMTDNITLAQAANVRDQTDIQKTKLRRITLAQAVAASAQAV